MKPHSIIYCHALWLEPWPSFRRVSRYVSLYSSHYTSILIPGQQGIFPVFSLCLLYESPSPQEIFVQHDTRKFSRNGSVHVLHDGEVGGEEDIKVALMYL